MTVPHETNMKTSSIPPSPRVTVTCPGNGNSENDVDEEIELPDDPYKKRKNFGASV